MPSVACSLVLTVLALAAGCCHAVLTFKDHVSIYVDGSGGMHQQQATFAHIKPTAHNLFLTAQPIDDNRNNQARITNAKTSLMRIFLGRDENIKLEDIKLLQLHILADGTFSMTNVIPSSGVHDMGKLALATEKATEKNNFQCNPQTLSFFDFVGDVVQPFQDRFPDAKVVIYLASCYGSAIVNDQLPLIKSTTQTDEKGVNLKIMYKNLLVFTMASDMQALFDGAVTEFYGGMDELEQSSSTFDDFYNAVVQTTEKKQSSQQRKKNLSQLRSHAKQLYSQTNGQQQLKIKTMERHSKVVDFSAFGDASVLKENIPKD